MSVALSLCLSLCLCQAVSPDILTLLTRSLRAATCLENATASLQAQYATIPPASEAAPPQAPLSHPPQSHTQSPPQAAPPQTQERQAGRHRIEDTGPRLTLLSPLHWSVHELSGTDLDAAGNLSPTAAPLTVRGSVFNLTDKSRHLELMIYINSPDIGQTQFPLPNVCAHSSFATGMCDFTFSVPLALLIGASQPRASGGAPMKPKGTFVLALRLVSPADYAVSVGPVSEVSFRVQPKGGKSWHESMGRSSCSRGFFRQVAHACMHACMHACVTSCSCGFFRQRVPPPSVR